MTMAMRACPLAGLLTGPRNYVTQSQKVARVIITDGIQSMGKWGREVGTCSAAPFVIQGVLGGRESGGGGGFKWTRAPHDACFSGGLFPGLGAALGAAAALGMSFSEGGVKCDGATSDASAITADEESAPQSADVLSDTTVVFSTLGCPFCIRAKNRLREQGIPFREVAVDVRPEIRKALVTTTGRRTVPVIFINGRSIGGAQELDEMIAQGKLLAIVEAPSQPLPEAVQVALSSLLSAPSETKGVSNRPSAGPSAGASRQQMRRLRLEQVAMRMGDPEKGVQAGAAGKATSGGEMGAPPASFSGSAAVAWMCQHLPDVWDSSEAEELGKELQAARLLHHVSFSESFSGAPGVFFRLHQDEPGISKSSALNAATVELRPVRAASEVAEDLRQKMLAMYEVALSADGRSIDYTSLSGSPTFAEYRRAAEELQRVDVLSLTRSEQLAFWINVYNSLVVHAIILNGPPRTSFDRLLFYARSSYHIGGADFSLNDIEHGVLRGNRTHSLSLFGARPFGPTDLRRFLSIVPLDPRIHFALNCGAKSCPPIKVFSAENLDVALDLAVSAFCEGEVNVDEESKVVKLSKLMDWYKADFGTKQEEQLQWLLTHLDEAKRQALEKGAETRWQEWKVEYAPYNWGLNEA
eukprot:TRINITY_DN4969_c0_g1_i1.p1 TRINITY_DN4969_c0_g1~~TRINITY_DN4969_c0_g1_i1.p1  ORF type:complete len:639 (-),score=117.84 TRINITY_DN4969_c0_g1_i1:279-2195(-)